MNDVKITEHADGWLLFKRPGFRYEFSPDEVAALRAHFAAEQVTITNDERVEKIARVMALVDDYDGCFERIDEWEAQPDWEKEAHPEEEPFSDREDAAFWIRRAQAVVAALAAEQPATPTPNAAEMADSLILALDERMGRCECQSYSGEKHDVNPPCRRRALALALAEVALAALVSPVSEQPTTEARGACTCWRLVDGVHTRPGCPHFGRRMHPAAEQPTPLDPEPNRLDPKPWMGWTGQRYAREDENLQAKWFQPRPEFEQDRARYEQRGE